MSMDPHKFFTEPAEVQATLMINQELPGVQDFFRI